MVMRSWSWSVLVKLTHYGVCCVNAEISFAKWQNVGISFVFVPPCLQFRFMLLSLAALEAPLNVPLGDKGLYGEDCIFIANDWHAALVPVYLAAKYRSHGVYTNARSIMAIHNLRHQGVYPPGTFQSLGLPDWWYGSVEYQYPPHLRQGAYEEEGRSVNHLKVRAAAAAAGAAA
jgi:glycogen synthase